MRPPKRESKDFEKVAVGEMLKGVIEKVEYDEKHQFKGFQGKEDTIQPAVRIALKLDGYKFLHRSRWMKFNTGSKANLYIKYISKLVEGIQPDCDFDLDILNSMPIKVVFSENEGFQNIDAIYPVGPKVKSDAVVVPTVDLDAPPIDEDGPEALPF